MRVLRDDKTGETELSGAASELFLLARTLRLNRGKLVLESGGDPSPYSRSLGSIEIERATEGVLCSVSAGSDVLDVCGGLVELDMLASNIEGMAEENDPFIHLHVEYPGHRYMAQGSDPLIIVVCP